LNWTWYADECLRVVEIEQEVESDLLLVQLVRLRLIAERLHELPCCSATTPSNGVPKPPIIFRLKSLQSQLQDFRRNIPEQLVHNGEFLLLYYRSLVEVIYYETYHLLPTATLLMELHSTELGVHELGLSQSPDAFLGQQGLRVDCLWACVQAVKSWMNIFLSLLPIDYIGFSPLTYFGMAHCFTCMYRLSVFEHAEWDRGLVRTQFDIVSFSEIVEQNFSKVKIPAGLDSDGSDDLDTFTIMASKISRVRSAWDPNKVASTAAEGTLGHDNSFDFSLELSDEDWLKDLIGPWSQY
jgi:hypothetical protein